MPGINLQGETEQSLMAALQEGRREVLGLLYDAYAPVMLGVISRIVPDQHLAEEVLQETFVAIWTRIKVYDASKNRFLIWGMAIARGIAIEAMKRDGYKQLTNHHHETTLQANPIAEAQQQAERKLCHLQPEEREALELICLKGYTCTEAAAKLGITDDTLKLRIKEAFYHLKAEKSA